MSGNRSKHRKGVFISQGVRRLYYLQGPNIVCRRVYLTILFSCPPLALKRLVHRLSIWVRNPREEGGLLDGEALSVDQSAQLLSLLVLENHVFLYHCLGRR